MMAWSGLSHRPPKAQIKIIGLDASGRFDQGGSNDDKRIYF